MPRWWVDEPYINLHIVDEPLSYTTSSGQQMAFRFNYKERFALPGLDQVPDMFDNNVGYNPIYNDPYATVMRGFVGPDFTRGMTNAAWSHNWLMNITFWDASSEFHGYPFQYSYEALMFNPDGGISYFNNNVTNQTLNPSTQLTNSVSQAQLVALSLSNFDCWPNLGPLNPMRTAFIGARTAVSNWFIPTAARTV